MPPTGDTEYDKFYAAEEQKKKRIEEYATYRSYDDLRSIALTYVDHVLRYKFDAGDTSEGLREYLAANHGIPNTPDAKWVGDLVIKNVIYNKDVDTKQLIGDAFGEYHFKHRNPMIDTRTVSEIVAAREREAAARGAAAREAAAIKNNSSSLQQGQQQNSRNLTRSEIIQKIKDTAETIGQCATMMVNDYHLHTNMTEARNECFRIMRRGK